MKDEWKVSRKEVPHDDGQRRWDLAYQFLLSWTMEQTVRKSAPSLEEEEPSHGNCPVCTSIDQPAVVRSVGRDVEGFYREKPAFDPESEGPILAATVDWMGAVMVPFEQPGVSPKS